MYNSKKQWFLTILTSFILTAAFSQAKEPGPFDFGKMWTFENPPKEWFLKEYQYNLDNSWFDAGRKSALRFASWCSASFVSPNGLVMTNHHCSEPVVSDLQKEGENFDKNGFYASTYAEERRNPELFVEQLIMVADVTDKMKAKLANVANDSEKMAKTEEAMAGVKKEFSTMSGWEGLRTQVVTYYSGGKYSLYGYKRYDDVRLVFIPEQEVAFFGGDPDNFTYPRYNLDCTFWRVYDENGKPMNTTDNYFKFNTDGIAEGTPVFVIGNPGSTERYRTVAQLEYDRDYRYPVDVEFFTDRMNVLQEQQAMSPNDDTKNTIFSLSNTLKATKGTLSGLENPDLFARKVKMEEKIRSNSMGKTYWDDMAKYYTVLSKYGSELRFLAPSPFSGKVLPLLYSINDYVKLAEANPESAELEGMEKKMSEMAPAVNDPKEVKLFAMVLKELNDFAQPDDEYLRTILDGRTPEVAAKEILSETVFADEKDLSKLLDKKTKKFLRKKDDLISAAPLLADQYKKAVDAFQSTGPARKAIEQNIAGEVFKVYGNALPPDATFTLRISDGRVKGYEYNGTTAPFKTTYAGMYDRYYSFDGKSPWSLPSRWLNPSMDLLKAPMNFVCTPDIIGGNSGSPIINVKRELVGLVFDGNIESLPGKFIFDDASNRTVAVHAGGIVAALRYMYKADRLVAELTGQ
ncbi:MAG: S46 family peptidase [Saprospiraceae bacterium]